VEVAVVEVGLGGRLDCTNVIAPEVSVITSIGLDHAEILGPTIEAIAAEKAGIIKAGVPVVFDPAERAEARAAIERAAAAMRAPIVPEEAPWPAGPGAFLGEHQRGNLRLALRALGALREAGFAVTERTVEEGLGRARWPGRLEAAPGEPRLWWDGAHNREAFESLVSAWQERHAASPAAIVLALSRDKDASAILRALAPFHGARIVATRSRSERAFPAAVIAEAAGAAGFLAEVLPDVATATRHALGVAPGRVLLTGSLFAVGEAMEAFGGAPGEQQ